MNSHVKKIAKNKHDVWPFPPFPNPLDKGNKVPKFNSDNFEDAPYVAH